MDEALWAVGENLAEEAFDEFTGRSRGKWVLLLLAFVAGAAVAVYLRKRRTAKATTAAHVEPSEG